MKILSVGNFGTGWDGSICDEEHIAGALEELGHTVTRHQRENEYAPDEKFDFVLIAQWDGYLEEMVPNLKKHCGPVVYWAFDYQNEGQEWHERLVAECDLYLSKRIADSIHSNWQWLSQDFAPRESVLDSVFNYGNHETDMDVLFTGSYLPWATERNETIKAVNEKYNLVVHSVNDWPFLERRPPVMDEGLPELYDKAKIILSIDHTLEAGYWSDRVAQILSCGGFVLNRYIPLMESRFPRDGLIYFYSIQDCLDKIDKYLNDGSNHMVERSHGRAWANQNGRAIHRVQDLLTIVKGIL